MAKGLYPGDQLSANQCDLSQNEPVSILACVFLCLLPMWRFARPQFTRAQNRVGGLRPSVRWELWVWNTPRAGFWAVPASSILVSACCHHLWDNVSPFWDCYIVTSDLDDWCSHSRPETSVTAGKPELWEDILRLKNHKPDRERHLIWKQHHLGYFNALDLSWLLSRAPSVTELWCQVTLADDLHLFLTVEQGHVWFGCTTSGIDHGQEGSPVQVCVFCAYDVQSAA